MPCNLRTKHFGPYGLSATFSLHSGCSNLGAFKKRKTLLRTEHLLTLEAFIVRTLRLKLANILRARPRQYLVGTALVRPPVLEGDISVNSYVESNIVFTIIAKIPER